MTRALFALGYFRWHGDEMERRQGLPALDFSSARSSRGFAGSLEVQHLLPSIQITGQVRMYLIRILIQAWAHVIPKLCKA